MQTPIADAEIMNSEAEMNKEMLYSLAMTCPCCSKKFITTFLRSRYQQVIKTDGDFCNYYKVLSPYFFEAIVCCHCGYSYTRELSDPLNPQTRGEMREALKNWKQKDYSGIRTLDKAIEAMTLAAFCQGRRNIKSLAKGKLYQKLAWLYRYKGDHKSEHRFLNLALECFLNFYEYESSGELRRELELMYLIGNLHQRLGYTNKAVEWYARLVYHKESDTYPAIVRMARKNWQEIKQSVKIETPAV